VDDPARDIEDVVEDDMGYASAVRAVLRNSTVAPAITPPEPEPEPAPFPLPELLPDLFFNRELSWLDFNQRVLEEATEPENPLLERVKFAAIFSSNLEGWYIIRLAGVRRKVRNGITTIGPDGRTPTAQFAVIRRRTQELLDAHAQVVREQLIPELRDAGIHLVPHA
jgi:polyphosphate kinase